MKEPSVDPERLAALLDGRLDEHAREQVLEQLALSPDELETLADAAAVTRELEEEGDGSVAPARGDPEGGVPDLPVVPITAAPSKRGAGWVPRRWLAVAALVAGVALVPVLWRALLSPEGGSPVAALSRPEAGLPAEWNGSPWDPTRSDGAALDPRVRAARLGARLADLEIQVRAGHPGASLAADRAGQLLAGVSGAAPLAGSLQAAGRDGTPEERLARIRSAKAELGGFVPAEWVALGEWAEVSRVAAARRDEAYFRSRGFEAALREAEELAPGDPFAVQWAAIRAALVVDGTIDWTALARAFAGALAAAAS